MTGLPNPLALIESSVALISLQLDVGRASTKILMASIAILCAGAMGLIVSRVVIHSRYAQTDCPASDAIVFRALTFMPSRRQYKARATVNGAALTA